MDWGTLAGTALGGLLGVSSTLLVDRYRWRRDRDLRTENLRRQVYGEYLLALSRTRNQLRDIAHEMTLAPAERAQQVREAVRDGGAFEQRHQLRLAAPHHVLDLAERTHLALRTLRDCVAGGHTAADQRYQDDLTAYAAASRAMRDAMRHDLGVDDGPAPAYGLALPEGAE
ncbi:hypothetical protein [Kitasatospora nipponensis]